MQTYFSTLAVSMAATLSLLFMSACHSTSNSGPSNSIKKVDFGKTKAGETLEQLAKRHAKQFDGKLGRVLKIINGYSASFSPAAVEKLKKQPEVKYIEKDGPVGIR